MNTKKVVAIYTTFSSADHAYSLNRVVQDQIKMLLAFGYEPRVIVLEGFKPVGAYALPGVCLEYLPRVTASNEGILPENWQEEVDKTYKTLRNILSGVQVCITHDVIAQTAALIHNLAARKVADELTELRWLHWVHSVFSSNMPSNIMEASAMGRKKFPNSYLVFPNSYDIPRLARNFNYEEPDVKYVPHPTDIEEFFGMHEDSRRFMKQYEVLEADVIMVYPCRLDRGKQPHYFVELAGAIKRNKLSVKAIIMDFHSTGGDKVTYRNEMKERAKQLGLTDKELIFFSDFDEKYRYEAPPQIVKDLMIVSNIFIMPSRSETYSLVTQEAALCGNFIFLNQDFLPFRSIFGDFPKYYQFSSNIAISGYDGNIETNYGNVEQYFDDIAKYVRYVLKYDRTVGLRTMLRRDRNLYAVMRNYLEPLIYGK